MRAVGDRRATAFSLTAPRVRTYHPGEVIRRRPWNHSDFVSPSHPASRLPVNRQAPAEAFVRLDGHFVVLPGHRLDARRVRRCHRGGQRTTCVSPRGRRQARVRARERSGVGDAGGLAFHLLRYFAAVRAASAARTASVLPGGAKGIRTPDPLHARQVRYHCAIAPRFTPFRVPVLTRGSGGPPSAVRPLTICSTWRRLFWR